MDDAGNVTVEPDKLVYWKNTQTADVTAWYPAERSSVDFMFQSRNGLTYVLRGIGTGNHQSPVTLQFKHQLAKVRVVAKGKAQVRNMEMVNLPGVCYIEEGIITGQSLPINRILMPRVEREGIDTYWEANVGPGVEIQWFSLDGMTFALNTPVTTQAGALHTITWTVNSAGTQSIRLSTDSIGNNGTEQSQ